MNTLRKINHALALKQLAALCTLLAAASAHSAGGGLREPPAGTNGWRPSVTVNAQVIHSTITLVRALPKSGR